MNFSRSIVLLLLWALSVGAPADELLVCYNYGCATSATVTLNDAQLARVNMLFAWVDTAQEEREAIAEAIGLLQVFVGQQTPTFRDRGRNLADDGVDGRMDCIDHSLNNTLYLNMMQERGWLRFHQAMEPVRRAPYLFIEHWAARIAELTSGREFAVDSWFFDHGMPAAMFPLEEWMRGAEPDD